MTIEAISPWVNAFLLLIVILILVFPTFRSKRDRFVAPEYSARYYTAYIGEVARLAGLDPGKFLAHVDLSNPAQFLKMATAAEAELLNAILISLTDEEWAELERKYGSDPVDEYDRDHRPGKSEEERRAAIKKRKFNFAMEVFKKINPILQQVAGSWATRSAGAGG